MAQLRAARPELAKIHDVERALNTDRCEVSAVDLAHARDRGVPLSGNLLTAAKMGNAYAKAIQAPERVGSPAVNNLVSGISAAGGAGVGAATGGAFGAGAGAAIGAIGVPLTQMAIRKMLLSGAYQRGMGTPNYDANVIGRTASKIPMTTANEALLRAYILSQQRGQQP